MAPKNKNSSEATLNRTHAFPVMMDPATRRTYDVAFTEKDANIVLQSSDGIFFRMSSFTLRTTSGFFRAMMTLPPLGDISSAVHRDDEITLEEESVVVGRLLRMISGFETPKWKSFDEVEDLLAAAYKYEMPGPLAAARTAFMWPFAAEQPLRLYAVAARYGWEEEAKLASKHSLTFSIHDKKHDSVLERVPSAWLLRLFRLHRERREAFEQKIIKNNIAFNIICENGFDLPKALPKADMEPWLNLARLMLWEIDRCPAGGVLFNGGWMEWPEAGKCLQKTEYSCCRRKHNFGQEVDIMVRTTLQALPSTI
ncbi:hypothetical protein PILCRDRAFT_810530 [Piloderma croceum F 1598]|uniref:Uncharacterized protein n=1 Tax=Piloderma croceum (strain F 1598) TaxID=765440 RepID=A0A0C3BXK2_PILCF|nr:hypothetical protein PILCRDRAFT_810530 [Piloderma croceum F 1598]